MADHYIPARDAELIEKMNKTDTCLTEGPPVGRVNAVTGEAVVFFNAFSSIVAETVVIAAVTRAARLDPWGHLRPLLKVKSQAVQYQGTNTSQKPLLPRCCTSCRKHKYILIHISFAGLFRVSRSCFCGMTSLKNNCLKMML